MLSFLALASFLAPLLGLPLCAHGAPENLIPNGDFERDRVGQAPSSWYLPPVSAEAGYSLSVVDDAAAGGSACAVLRGKSGAQKGFGNCLESVEASALHGKRVRFSAAVRCEPSDETSRAQLWMRVDRAGEEAGFFDNMDDRPIRDAKWRRYEIVGDVASDATGISLGMMLIGGGVALLDDVVVEVVDDTTALTGRSAAAGAPGLQVVLYEAKLEVRRKIEATTVRFPLPLAYRDQTPLTFRLEFDPPVVAAQARIANGPGPNRVLELELRDVGPRKDVTLRYESVVLVAPTSFDALPKRAPFPKTWPADAAAWLEATWCCDAKDERLRKIGSELRASSDDVLGTVDLVLKRSQELFAKAEGRVRDLTAVEALDKQGSCTSCANLVAALLRACGVPARILAGYPTWSGPLQTHYIVEAFVPSFGWYPVESTMGRAAWPNDQQIHVSIVPIEHESKERAGRRSCAGGAVPFMTLTEHASGAGIDFSGTLKPHCDHEARMLRAIEADASEWSKAQAWARERWETWLASKPEIREGVMHFGPARDAIAARSLTELKTQLR